MFKLRNRALSGHWAPLPLRLIIGFGFMAHGWAKLSRGPSGFAKLLAQIDAPLPEATAWASTFVELLGGLAIFVGAFVEVVSIPLIVMMLVAMFTVHLKYGFSSINTIELTARAEVRPTGLRSQSPVYRGSDLADLGRRGGVVHRLRSIAQIGFVRWLHHNDRASSSRTTGGYPMRAILRTGFGGPEVLVIREIPEPEPKDGHAVIEVKAFGLNHAEVHMRKGEWAEIADVSGIECVGVVKSCPGGEFAPGTKVGP
jgi:uncharacterized membrane protein YphA (DoxX/SURF4 family)